MKIEVGKKYRMRDGGTAVVDERTGYGSWPFGGSMDSDAACIAGEKGSWTPEGRYSVEIEGAHNFDLVAEIDEAPTPEPVEVCESAAPMVPEGPLTEPVYVTKHAGEGAGAVHLLPHLANFPVAIIAGASPELQLMCALEQVIRHFEPDTNATVLARAAKWLHDRHELPF